MPESIRKFLAATACSQSDFLTRFIMPKSRQQFSSRLFWIAVEIQNFIAKGSASNSKTLRLGVMAVKS